MARGRRRLVSVLFADLVGFTELGERLDPEDVEAVQERYFRAARGAVEQHGGEVEKYIGDAVVAGFGIRDRADDAARRAVRAAVDLRAAVADLGTELSWLERPLEVRVGVATGEVVVADDGHDWRLTGDTVNTAARLQTAAVPGEILIGPETTLAVSGAVPVEEVAPLTLKGKRDPVRAWRVAGSSVQTGTWLPVVPMVGRDRELADLEARVATGAAATLVVAAPGLGRSLLLATVAGRSRGRRVVAVRPSDASDDPYELVTGCFAGLTSDRGRPVDELRSAASTTSSPLTRTGLELAVQALEGRSLAVGPDQLFPAWVAALGELLDRPTLLVLDDLHLASADARSFVTRLVAAELPDLSVLASTRPAALMGRHAERFADVVHLGPLPRAAMAELLDALVGRGTLPAGLRERVLDAAGGTPLYVVELLRRWLRDGDLRSVPGGAWELRLDGAGPTEPPVPSTIQALYTGELDELPERPRELVSVASVPGLRFPTAVLPVLGVPEPEPLLSSLVTAGLLRRARAEDDGGDRYAFRHRLLREVAYAELLRRERAELHLRYAAWLRDEAGDGASDAEVATHLEAALASLPRAVREDGPDVALLGEEAGAAWERAARRDLVSAPERAAERAARAVTLAAGPDRAPRLLLLADAARRSGALREARVSYAEAADAARVSGDVDHLVAAALGYESALHAARERRDGSAGRTSEELLDEALDHVDPLGAPAARARLLAARGQARSWRGDAAAGRADLDAAVRTAEASGDAATLAAALLAARTAHREPDQLAWRTSAARAAIEAATRAGELELVFEAERFLLTDLLEAGAGDGADRVLQRAVEHVAELRMPVLWWYPAMWEAMMALRVGDLERAERAIARFADVASRGRYRDAGHVVRAQLLRLRVDQGRHDEAQAIALLALREDPARWAAPVAGTAAEIGDRGLAEEAVAWHLERDLAAVPDDLSRSFALASLAEGVVATGDRVAAARVHALLEPWRGHAVVVGAGALCTGSVDRRLGLLERTLGRADEARRSLEAAAARDRASGERPAEERARAALATVSSPT